MTRKELQQKVSKLVPQNLKVECVSFDEKANRLRVWIKQPATYDGIDLTNILKGEFGVCTVAINGEIF